MPEPEKSESRPPVALTSIEVKSSEGSESVKVIVARVDLDERKIDLELVKTEKRAPTKTSGAKAKVGKPQEKQKDKEKPKSDKKKSGNRNRRKRQKPA